MSKKASSVRLPTSVLPERYQLTFRPDLKKFTFEGEAVISINVSKPVREITLHAKELKARVISPAAKVVLNEKGETLTLKFAVPLKKGHHKLHLSFTGVLNDNLRGFYRSKYEVDGKEEYMATTQFEATDARRAFPCFDEPDKKAIFSVTLVVDKKLTAISNTLAEKVTESAGTKTFVFAPTPKMSTYLLAFIVGKFEHVETKTPEGVIVRVLTTPGRKAQAKFALATAAKMLSFYSGYFNIEYPMKAMQLIAIPDFGAGAMENWGLVTYRESALLIDEHQSSVMNKQWVALVIAHELAHQWFGNLVTMEWWTHLWLNEGFASYIEYLAVNEMFPEWDIWTQFAVHDLGGALRLDSLKTTHPIEVEVHHPDEISEIFDAVSYSKGASVIRMLASYLGEKNFRDGLRLYLKRHKFANAKTEDLWRSLSEVSKEPVAKIMKNWTGKPGYPLLTLEERKDGKLVCTQRRFFSNAQIMRTYKDATVWHIPLGLGVKDAPKLQSGKQLILETQAIPAGTKFNQGETAILRVRYPASWFPVLERQIEGNKFSAPDRLGIIRDAFALAEAGVGHADEALRLLRSYRNETDYTVWANLSTNVGQVSNVLYGTDVYEAYRNFARSVFAEIARKMGWKKHPNERHSDTMLRSLALGNFAAYGDKETIRTAKELFEGATKGGGDIDADLRGMVYGSVGEHGTAKDHELLMKLYRTASVQQEKDRLSGALTGSREITLLKKTLAFAMSKDVRSQDAPGIIAGVGANPYGRELMWEFTQKNWKTLLKKYGHGGHMLPYFLRPLSGFHDLAHAKQVEQFFKKNKAPGAERTVQQVLERIRSNADWLKRDQKKIAAFLTSYEPMQ